MRQFQKRVHMILADQLSYPHDPSCYQLSSPNDPLVRLAILIKWFLSDQLFCPHVPSSISFLVQVLPLLDQLSSPNAIPLPDQLSFPNDLCPISFFVHTCFARSAFLSAWSLPSAFFSNYSPCPISYLFQMIFVQSAFLSTWAFLFLVQIIPLPDQLLVLMIPLPDQLSSPNDLLARSAFFTIQAHIVIPGAASSRLSVTVSLKSHVYVTPFTDCSLLINTSKTCQLSICTLRVLSKYSVQVYCKYTCVISTSTQILIWQCVNKD